MDTAAKKGLSTRTILLIIGGVGLAFFTLIAAFIIGMVMMVGGMMKNNPVYQDAVAMAQSDPRITRELGEPIETGRFTTGSFSTSGGTGDADLAIPLKGPDGRATAYVTGVKQAGVWDITSLTVTIKETDERITLVE